MSFTYERRYRGKIQAVLLDWAGTTMDYGCMAPTVVFVEVFKRQGVPITVAEARAPMGAHKRVHIKRITELEPVSRRWQERHGQKPTEADVDRMFAEFVPIQLACLSDYSELIPGTLEAVAAMRRRGIKIGSSVGVESLDGVFYFSHMSFVDRAQLFWRRAGAGGEKVASITKSLEDIRATGYCTSIGDLRREVHAVGVPMRRNVDGEIVTFNCGVPMFILKKGQLEDDIGPRLVAMVRNIEASLGMH